MLALAGCLFYYYYNAGRFSNTYSELKDQMNQKKIETERLDSGKWYLNSQVKDSSVHTWLSFQENGTVITYNDAGDTLISRYTLNKDTLWFSVNERGRDTITGRKIILHGNQELVLESSGSENPGLKYSRTDRSK